MTFLFNMEVYGWGKKACMSYVALFIYWLIMWRFDHVNILQTWNLYTIFDKKNIKKWRFWCKIIKFYDGAKRPLLNITGNVNHITWIAWCQMIIQDSVNRATWYAVKLKHIQVASQYFINSWEIIKTCDL